MVIPVYNEEAILAPSVAELLRGFAAARHRWTSRSCSPRTAAATAPARSRRSWPARTRRCAPSRAREPNYGAALRQGIEGARGEYVLCEEIDLCDLDFHRRALELLRGGGADLVVGSKAMRGAHDRRPLAAPRSDALYNGLLRVTLGFTGTDTHGLKAFRRAALLPVVARCIVGHDVFASRAGDPGRARGAAGAGDPRRAGGEARALGAAAASRAAGAT